MIKVEAGRMQEYPLKVNSGNPAKNDDDDDDDDGLGRTG